jgi:hypothetical protein
MNDQLEHHIEIQMEPQMEHKIKDYENDEVLNLDLSIYDDNLSVAYSVAELVDDQQPIQMYDEDDLDYFREYILTPINNFFIIVINFIYAL